MMPIVLPLIAILFITILDQSRIAENEIILHSTTISYKQKARKWTSWMGSGLNINSSKAL
jgi:hypothetical protein